jgi:hypothetical protein
MGTNNDLIKCTGFSSANRQPKVTVRSSLRHYTDYAKTDWKSGITEVQEALAK